MSTISLDRRSRLSDQSYATLRSMIVRGELEPEARIVEAELAQRLVISRTPLREALLRLADEGLVVIYPQVGSFVAPIRIEAAVEAQFIREQLERAIIRELAARISRDGLSLLHSNLLQQDAAIKNGDSDRFYEMDEALHASFAVLAGHPAAWRAIEQSKGHLDRIRRLSLSHTDQIPRLVQQHRSIVDALGAHDPNAAEIALRGHLREVFKTIENLGLATVEAKRPPKGHRGRLASAPDQRVGETA